MNEKFLEVGDVMQILGISRSAAYKLMRQINSELEKKGYIVIRGKVSRKYFEERIYGMIRKWLIVAIRLFTLIIRSANTKN